MFQVKNDRLAFSAIKVNCLVLYNLLETYLNLIWLTFLSFYVISFIF